MGRKTFSFSSLCGFICCGWWVSGERVPEWWHDLNPHSAKIWIQRSALIKGRAVRAKPRVTSALHKISASKFRFRGTSVLCQRTDVMYFLDYLLYMNVYRCMYNIYRCCTQKLCQKDSCFQTASHPVDVWAGSSYRLVPAGGPSCTWQAVCQPGGLVPNARPLAVLKLRKMPYLTLCSWPGTFSLW